MRAVAHRRPQPATAIVPVPAVTAHRGASGDHPEHTLAAHRAAVRVGADAVELDVVMTRDGVPVVRHENELSRSTDVAARPEFATRRTRRQVDGEWVVGWFTEDFTLAELRLLRCREPNPTLRPHVTRFDGVEPPATLIEVLETVEFESRRRGRRTDVLIELKHVAHFGERGLDLPGAVLDALAALSLDEPTSGVTLMAFEVAPLQRLATATRLPIVQLVDACGSDGDGAVDDAWLDHVDTYADGIGVHRHLVLPRRPDGRLGTPTDLVARAHHRGLTVQVWTLRAENVHLPADLRSSHDRGFAVDGEWGDLASEVVAFLDAGVDGVTTDHPGIALDGLDRFVNRGRRPAGPTPAQRAAGLLDAAH